MNHHPFHSGIPECPFDQCTTGGRNGAFFHGGSRRTQGERAHWFLLSHAEYLHPMTVCWLTRIKCIPNERCSATQQCITGITNQHLVGGLEPFLFVHIIGNNNPQLPFIFFRGVETTNQTVFVMVYLYAHHSFGRNIPRYSLNISP